MRILVAIVIVFAVSAGQARAQSFEKSLEQGRDLSAQARKTLAERPRVAAPPPAAFFAGKIVCAMPAGPGLPEFLRFYTRLDGVRSLEALPADETAALEVWDGESPRADESAARVGDDDHRAASVTRKSFRYSLWTCDTTDYWFSFETTSLARRSAEEVSRPVKGHLIVETRSEKDWEGDLSCTAFF